MTTRTDVEWARRSDARYPVEGGKVVPYVLLSEEFIVDGAPYYQTFDAGVAASATLGIEGYVWPYVRVGQSIYEPPPLWFMVLGFRAPARWVETFLQLQRKHQFRMSKGYQEIWEMREQALCDGLSVLVPQHPDPSLNDQLKSWRVNNARRFLTLGGVDPDNPEVVMSDLPCPLPRPVTRPLLDL